ncbi:MAG TPA: hypothetical protein VJT75_00615 [Thermoleophilaceae bacterium]|nr:hypothetical protein [Thermoleophilaceae bacterium]
MPDHDEKRLMDTDVHRVRLCAVVVAGLLAVAAAPAAALVTLPLNDGAGSPAKLSGAHASEVGTNLLATKQPGEPAHGGGAGGASVWYSWTAPRSGPAQVNTCSKATTFNTLLAVYRSNGAVPPFSNLTRVAGNDDHPGGACSGGRSLVDFDASGGTTYRIAVDGVGGATGAFQLNVGEVSDYAGRTSQGQAVSFSLSDDRKRVTGLKIQLTATCRLTGLAAPTTNTFPLGSPSAFTIRAGEFGRTVERTTLGVYEQKRVRGARDGRRWNGTARYLTDSLGGSCDSDRVGWSARPTPLHGLAG